MPKVVEGTLRGGKIEFEQPPPGKDGERVLVTFVSQEVPLNPKMITYGEFRSEGPQPQWSDFVEAKRALYKNTDGEQNADTSRG